MYHKWARLSYFSNKAIHPIRFRILRIFCENIHWRYSANQNSVKRRREKLVRSYQSFVSWQYTYLIICKLNSILFTFEDYIFGWFPELFGLFGPSFDTFGGGEEGEHVWIHHSFFLTQDFKTFKNTLFWMIYRIKIKFSSFVKENYSFCKLHNL